MCYFVVSLHFLFLLLAVPLRFLFISYLDLSHIVHTFLGTYNPIVSLLMDIWWTAYIFDVMYASYDTHLVTWSLASTGYRYISFRSSATLTFFSRLRLYQRLLFADTTQCISITSNYTSPKHTPYPYNFHVPQSRMPNHPIKE